MAFAEWVLFALTLHFAKPEKKNEVLNSQNIYILYIALSQFLPCNEIIFSQFLLDMTSISNVFNTLTLCHDIC